MRTFLIFSNFSKTTATSRLASTGLYGQRRADAVAEFQQDNGLESVGSVGPKTLALLNGALRLRHPTPTSAQGTTTTTSRPHRLTSGASQSAAGAARCTHCSQEWTDRSRSLPPAVTRNVAKAQQVPTSPHSNNSSSRKAISPSLPPATSVLPPPQPLPHSRRPTISKLLVMSGQEHEHLSIRCSPVAGKRSRPETERHLRRKLPNLRRQPQCYHQQLHPIRRLPANHDVERKSGISIIGRKQHDHMVFDQHDHLYCIR